MDKELRSILYQMNRLVEKKTGTKLNEDDISNTINYLSSQFTGVNPKKQTIAEALEYYVDNYIVHSEEGILTDDATAQPEDIMKDKTAYARGLKITGTYEPLDMSDATATPGTILKDKTAYVDGVKITGTYDGLDTSDATATADDILKGKTAYVDGQKVTGKYKKTEGGEFADSMEQIPYLDSRVVTAITKIPDDLEFENSASYLFRNCTRITEAPRIGTAGVTHYVGTFQNCKRLETAPNYNTHDAVEFQNMFRECVNLKHVPEYDVTNIKTSAGFTNMFLNCNSLTYDSINNILAMCTKATMYNGPKNLYEVGIKTKPLRPEAPYEEEIIKTLPNWQDFWMAGWTIE